MSGLEPWGLGPSLTSGNGVAGECRMTPDEEDRLLWKIVLMSMLLGMVVFFFTDSALATILVMIVFAITAAIKIGSTPRR